MRIQSVTYFFSRKGEYRGLLALGSLFPDTILIQEKEIRFVYRTFFGSRADVPVFFDDIRTLNVSTDIFFGTLSVDLKSTDINPPPVRFLKKAEARRARRIITGLMICERDKIPLSKLSTEEALKLTERMAGETLG